MNRSMIALLSTLVLAFALCGCRTRLLVSEISGLEGCEKVDGLPFRVRETYTVRVMRAVKAPGTDGDEIAFEQVHVTEKALANPYRLFALDINSEAFAQANLQVDYLPDGTLSVAHLDAGTTNLDAASTSLTNVGTALEDLLKIEDKIREREAELRAAEETDQTAQKNVWASLVLLEGQVQALLVACEDYTNAPAAEKEAKASAVRVILIEINKIYIDLGRPVPYPNVNAVKLDEFCK